MIFKHHRYVKSRDGTRVFKLAPLRKTLYSLRDLAPLMRAANDRYLATYPFKIGRPAHWRCKSDRLDRL